MYVCLRHMYLACMYYMYDVLLENGSHYNASELMSCSGSFNLLIQPSPPFMFTFLCVFSFSQALILTPYFSEGNS